MAKLQMFGRLGTAGVPLQSFLSPSCMRVGASCGSAAVSKNSKGSDRLSICASAAASNSESSTCSSGGWARFPGWVYRSTTATEKGGVPRAASLLEIEAPVETEITSGPSDSTQQATIEARLLEIEAPVETEITSSPSDSTQQATIEARLLETEAPVETDITSGPSDSTQLATFEAQVKAGRLECGSRGCRPIFSGPSTEDCCASRVVEDEDLDNNKAFRLLEARVASYTERRAIRDLEMSTEIGFALDFAEYVNDVWQEKSVARNHFEIAMKNNPNDAKVVFRYAQFAWKTLGDLDKADELFTRAVEGSPSDSDMHAMRALFLWQTDQ